MPNQPLARSCLSLILLIQASFVFATSNTEMNLEEVAQASEVIVAGSVISTSTEQTGNSANTIITLQVSDEIKGQATETITISVPGGSYRSGRFLVGETYAGAPAAFVNQRGLYFLAESADQNTYNIVGFNQGLMIIEASADGDIVRGTLTGGEPVTMTEMKSRISSMESE